MIGDNGHDYDDVGDKAIMIIIMMMMTIMIMMMTIL